ncbi:MAG: caspase family protein [Burkholderiales bacterium]|nr:caspase family protein [Burkholderiales bacterium]
MLMLFAWAALANAAEPTTTPILRIETEMHTASINRIATDAAGQYAVTASTDKTLRVWNLPNGQLLKVLRPPIGDGNDGKLYTVAMSPDGSTIAAGGWTRAGDNAHNLFVFDRAGGRMTYRVAGLPSTIHALAWSPDGRYVAAGLGANKGIRLYNGKNFALLVGDSEYGDDVNGADFDRSGRLVVSSSDGNIRLYQVSDSGLRQLAKQEAPAGKAPGAVRFSPDGKSIAVAYYDARAVSVLDATTLALKYSPNVATVHNGNLSTVAWSADGQQLYAGGRHFRDGANPVRSWSQAGRGEAIDIPAAPETVISLAPLAGGGVIFASTNPALGTIDASGKRRLLIASSVADPRNNREGFKLSSSAEQVSFAFEYGGKNPMSFDVRERRATAGVLPQLAGPVLQAASIDVSNWKSSQNPKLNGKPLALRQNETSHCIAIAPGGDAFVLGTTWYLRLFDQTGKLQWEQPTLEATWAVNIASNGRVLAAAFADGTIRWHRLSDGKEILALFMHRDQKRWVLWTPSGYYDAAPGAEDLIGWHINRGKDQAADFYPASRFRSQYYRPDVIDRVLTTLDEAEALKAANEDGGRRSQAADIKKILPPVVEILSPQDGIRVNENAVKLRFSARSDVPINAIRVRVNGQNISSVRNLGVKETDAAQEAMVPLSSEDNEILVFAENQHGVSAPAKLQIKWTGAPAATTASRPSASKEEFQFKPKLYVLAIGVSEHKQKHLNLEFAAKDAADFVATMKKQQGTLYRGVEVKMLTDKLATKDEVLDGLDWLRKQVTSKDVGMLFIAGHGTHDSDGTYYFVTHDTVEDKLRRTAVPQNEIKTVLANLAGKAIFFIDTCHSGSVITGRRSLSNNITGFLNELTSAENGVLVFAASTGKQFSQERPDWGNGAFTKALVEGLNGKADLQHTGRITHKALDYYIADRVKQLTNGEQTPVTITPPYGVPDYPIAVTK